jgi:hypothetical protein
VYLDAPSNAILAPGGGAVKDAPKVLDNGIAIGAGPDEAEFDQPGSGELESETVGGLKISGRLKVEGYRAQELIEVKNP